MKKKGIKKAFSKKLLSLMAYIKIKKKNHYNPLALRPRTPTFSNFLISATKLS